MIKDCFIIGLFKAKLWRRSPRADQGKASLATPHKLSENNTRGDRKAELPCVFRCYLAPNPPQP